MKLAIVLAAVVGFVAVLAGYIALTIAGKDTAGFVALASAAAVFLIPQIFQLVKAHQTQNDVTEIKQRTNGPLTDVQNQVKAIVDEVSQLRQMLTQHLGDTNARNP